MVFFNILEFLKENSHKEDKKQWIKTVKVHKDAYGVKLAKINPMISKWVKEVSFEDIGKLWKDEKVESRIIAAKLLGKIGKKDPDKALELVESFVYTLKDWATTDTLATQGIRGILKSKGNEIKSFALKCIKNKNVWVKRFGIVVFINFLDDKRAREIAEKFVKSKEYYVRKAAEWLMRKINLK